MSNTTVSTSVANPIRTGVQGGVAWGVTELLDSFEILPMDERQYVAVLLLLTIVVSAIQNLTENHFGIAFLRNVPEAQQKVVDNNGNAGA